jgi:taurine transport system substrate-binding protein
MIRTLAAVVLCALAAALGAPGTRAADKEVAIGFQLIYNPWKVAIADGVFERETGYAIRWRRYDSGAKVVAAMAAGEVDIALAGSSPIAAAVSRGMQIEVFWVAEDIASAEALVVRNGSGIVAPRDLMGRKVAVPFASTAHFHLLFALEQFGIEPGQVQLLNLQPEEIVSAWQRGDIDAAFVWNPALGQIKSTGAVLITSGLLTRWGKATFDALVVDKRFGAENPEFMTDFVRIVAEADDAYRSQPEAWGADSPMVQKIVGLVGGDAADVPDALALYGFPTLEEQVSCQWLGCGAEGGVARALQYTSEFLLKERKIEALQEDYSRFVNPSFAEAALAK